MTNLNYDAALGFSYRAVAIRNLLFHRLENKA